MDKDTGSNKENHSITQILVFLCLLICIVSLWFSVNTYYMIKNYIDVESGRVNRTQVSVFQNE